jgi:excisionase family DNA binding protein
MLPWLTACCLFFNTLAKRIRTSQGNILMAYLDRTQEGLEAFMTVAEAARYLGVGRKIVYQLVEFERIRSLRRGRVLWVDNSSLDEFQRSGQMV